MSQFVIDRKHTQGDLPVDTISSVQSSATGANYVVLPDLPGCRVVRIMSPSVALSVRKVATPAAVMTAKADQETLIYVANNANELEIKRADSSNTQVTTELLLGGY